MNGYIQYNVCCSFHPSILPFLLSLFLFLSFFLCFSYFLSINWPFSFTLSIHLSSVHLSIFTSLQPFLPPSSILFSSFLFIHPSSIHHFFFLSIIHASFSPIVFHYFIIIHLSILHSVHPSIFPSLLLSIHPSTLLSFSFLFYPSILSFICHYSFLASFLFSFILFIHPLFIHLSTLNFIHPPTHLSFFLS